MSKQITIEYCKECPYLHIRYMNKYCEHKLGFSLNRHNWLEIPDWCPLPDYKEDE